MVLFLAVDVIYFAVDDTYLAVDGMYLSVDSMYILKVDAAYFSFVHSYGFYLNNYLGGNVLAIYMCCLFINSKLYIEQMLSVLILCICRQFYYFYASNYACRVTQKSDKKFCLNKFI